MPTYVRLTTPQNMARIVRLPLPLTDYVRDGQFLLWSDENEEVPDERMLFRELMKLDINPDNYHCNPHDVFLDSSGDLDARWRALLIDPEDRAVQVIFLDDTIGPMHEVLDTKAGNVFQEPVGDGYLLYCLDETESVDGNDGEFLHKPFRILKAPFPVELRIWAGRMVILGVGPENEWLSVTLEPRDLEVSWL